MERYFEIYLGDAVYAYIAPNHSVVLYTSDGISETNRIVLDLSVIDNYSNWINKVAKMVEEGNLVDRL